MFCVTKKADLERDVEKALKLGRITLQEFLLTESLFLSIKNHADGVASINAHIKVLDLAGLDTQDLNQVLWKFVQTVLSGQPLA